MRLRHALLPLLLLLPGAAFPDAFERITPAEAGYSDDGLAALRAHLQAAGSESMLLLKDGKVFFEYGDLRRKRLLHSIRKPLLNALIGIENGEGDCLLLDRCLSDYGLQDDTPLTAQEQSATLRQLLQSRSGITLPAAAETEGMAAERPARGSHAPGSHWYYNNWDFNAAGALYEQCSGRAIHAAFLQRIAKPLGMLDYHGRVDAWPDDEDIDEQTDGYRRVEAGLSRFPAYHFRLSTHDLALFGQLYLQRGRWQGRTLVPAAWVDLSTQPVSVLQPEYGLAYEMLWNGLLPDDDETRPAFYHTGLGVHMLGVYPSLGLVMVHRVDTEHAFDYDADDLLRVIRLMHAARQPVD